MVTRSLVGIRTESRGSAAPKPKPLGSIAAQHPANNSAYLVWISRESGWSMRGCGRGAGHMVKVLSKYFSNVDASDAGCYGYGKTGDFLGSNHHAGKYDLVITNPPFNLAEEFVLSPLDIASCGAAILTRTVFIESVGRYERPFKSTLPSYFAQFVERMLMVKGRLDQKASTATGYSWLAWDKKHSGPRGWFGYRRADVRQNVQGIT
jgi:hypothetical protein